MMLIKQNKKLFVHVCIFTIGHNTRTLKLKQQNGIQPISISLFTPVLIKKEFCDPKLTTQLDYYTVKRRLTGTFTNTFSISAEEKYMVRGVIKCCSREREKVRE